MSKLKLVKDLVVGDRVVLADNATASVLSMVESVQSVRYPVIIVTLELERGGETHRTYRPNSSIRMQDTGE